MIRFAAAFLSIVLAGCGYTLSARRSDGSAVPIAVRPIREPGLDVDAGAEVSRAVRQAVARSPGMVLVDSPESLELSIEVLDVGSGLAPFTEPTLRAAQYVVRVSVRGQLYEDGALIWTSTPIRGEGRYLSTPGGIETLDGARRRSLSRAAEEAADRLVLATRAALAR